MLEVVRIVCNQQLKHESLIRIKWVKEPDYPQASYDP
jgi:hypothetical protein